MGSSASVHSNSEAINAEMHQIGEKTKLFEHEIEKDITEAGRAGIDAINRVFDSDSTLEEDDSLVAMKALCLCQLSYFTSVKEENLKLEQKWISKLGIENYRYWHSPSRSYNKTIGAVAISGVISNLCQKNFRPTPFICFRGTWDVSDIEADVASRNISEFVTKKGVPIGRAGHGFISHYLSLRELKYNPDSDEDMIDYILAECNKHDNGLLICGHSLGGAMASLLASELGKDYSLRGIEIVTFGCPRVFEPSVARIIAKLPQLWTEHQKTFRTLRFVNHGDLIPSVLKNDLCHASNPLYRHHNGSHWHYIPDFDWAHKEDLDNFSEFFTSGGGTHSIFAHSGYQGNITHNIAYQNALLHANEQVKNSFLGLPLAVNYSHVTGHLEDNIPEEKDGGMP